jgi:hypothetical protein
VVSEDYLNRVGGENPRLLNFDQQARVQVFSRKGVCFTGGSGKFRVAAAKIEQRFAIR